MKRATLKTVQASLGAYVKSSLKQPIMILDNGVPVALLVGLAKNGKRPPVKLRDVLRAAWQEYEEHGGISHEQFWKDLETESPRRKTKREKSETNHR